MIEPANTAAVDPPLAGRSSSRDGFALTGPMLSWLAATGLALVAMSIVAAQAPARVRLLALFPIVVGGAMGAASGMFAKSMRVGVTARSVVAVGGLALVALAASTWQTFRLDAASRSVSPREQQMALNLMQQMERDSGGEFTAAPVASATDEFRQYLARRVRQLGAWSSPWPELFWAIELLAGGAAAMWGLRRGVRPGKEQPALKEAAL